jgi:glycosyltransferase involved in cell wall biosynthesis
MEIHFLVRGDVRIVGMSATEDLTYYYAKFLKARGKDVEMLLAYSFGTSARLKPDYKVYARKYGSLKERKIGFTKIRTPVPLFSLIYLRDLPSGTTYIPYSFYDYLLNLVLKRKDQTVVFGGHCLEVYTKYPVMRSIINVAERIIFRLRGNDIYFHTINLAQKRYLMRLGLPERNIFYVPNFIDYKDFPVKANSTRKLRVLHIGGASKNSEFLPRILDRLMENGEFERFEFFLIGFSQPPEVVRYAKAHKNIRIMGYVSEREKYALLRSADALVITSRETFSIVALEALECGPIIVSRPNPAVETMRDLGASLFMLSDDEPDSYVCAFHKLMRLKAKPRRMAAVRARNKRVCERHFSSRRILPQFAAMFDKIEKKAA